MIDKRWSKTYLKGEEENSHTQRGRSYLESYKPLGNVTRVVLHYGFHTWRAPVQAASEKVLCLKAHLWGLEPSAVELSSSLSLLFEALAECSVRSKYADADSWQEKRFTEYFKRTENTIVKLVLEAAGLWHFTKQLPTFFFFFLDSDKIWSHYSMGVFHPWVWWWQLQTLTSVF